MRSGAQRITLFQKSGEAGSRHTFRDGFRCTEHGRKTRVSSEPYHPFSKSGNLAGFIQGTQLTQQLTPTRKHSGRGRIKEWQHVGRCSHDVLPGCRHESEVR
ncbi:hypothetical protein AA0229_0968 [Gluconobacter cerinus NRIC 0229]|nr:hypothetical protein AA0229_0968 [Gluconobacter cerinus NRIC 0229]